MRRIAVLTVALATLLAGSVGTAIADDNAALSTLLQLAQRGRNADDGMPKGPYQQSCQCQISGGIFLQCFCANLNARMFQTNMDIRTCPAPKEIKNCDGTLRCKEKAEEC